MGNRIKVVEKLNKLIILISLVEKDKAKESEPLYLAFIAIIDLDMHKMQSNKIN